MNSKRGGRAARKSKKKRKGRGGVVFNDHKPSPESADQQQKALLQALSPYQANLLAALTKLSECVTPEAVRAAAIATRNIQIILERLAALEPPKVMGPEGAPKPRKRHPTSSRNDAIDARRNKTSGIVLCGSGQTRTPGSHRS